MKARELRELTDDELRAKLHDLMEELFSIRFKVEPEKNTAKIRLLKRDIARVKTILRERELKAEH